jgi:hypothetical protein
MSRKKEQFVFWREIFCGGKNFVQYLFICTSRITYPLLYCSVQCAQKGGTHQSFHFVLSCDCLLYGKGQKGKCINCGGAQLPLLATSDSVRVSIGHHTSNDQIMDGCVVFYSSTNPPQSFRTIGSRYSEILTKRRLWDRH